MNDDLRTRQITVAVIIGMAGNAILAVMKVTAGLLAGSMAVLADGIDSSTDVLISLVSLVATRIMSRPSDAEHPFGHGRAETIATNILAFVVFFAGAQLAINTVGELVRGTVRELPAQFALWVTAVSIVGKLLLALNQFAVGRRTGSAMLIANGKNMRNDILTSVAVFLGLGATYLLKMPVLDTIFALLVSGFIIKTAVEIFLEVNMELMDGNTDKTLYLALFEAVKQVDGASNPHRARIRRMAQSLAIDVDIEVDGRLSVSEGHRIAVAVERSIKSRIDSVYDVMVHVEPSGSHEENERYGLCENSVSQNERSGDKPGPQTNL